MTDLDTIVQFIQSKKKNFVPKVGLVLGSGLGALADEIKEALHVIPFSSIPGFPRSTVAGHKGQLVLGKLGNMPVVCMQGRIHSYEGPDGNAFKIFVRTLKLLGCDTLIITCAAGSLREEVGAGQLMLINDHLNLQHRNPLIGANDDAFGDRFIAMDNAYDMKLRQRIHTVALSLQMQLTEGVYVGVTGPTFETPAEIRAFRTLGGDLIGMSVVPEVIIARHCGLRVAAIASITNLGAGMRPESLSHDGTLHYANIAAKNLSHLIVATLESLEREPI